LWNQNDQGCIQMKKKNRAAEPNTAPVKEAEETLRAICDGAVDAFVVEEPEGHRVYTLEGADLPYSVLVERMREGAAILDARGDMIYCNPSLGDLIGVSRETVIGHPFRNFLPAADHSLLQKLLHETQSRPTEGEMSVRRGDGALISANFSFRLLSPDRSLTGVLITDLTVQKQQRELTSRLQQLQDDERRRIARELHDSVGQLLAAITMNISKVKHEAHKLSPETAQLVDDNAAMINEISSEIRTISHLLHPPLLDEVGLSSALRWYIAGFAERSKINATLEMTDTLVRLPQDVEIAIFRAVQECLTNIHRHSGSPSCAVKLIQVGDQLRVEIKDTGRGIPPTKQLTMPSSGGVGLRGMQERIRQLGGTLEINSSKNGTVVIANLPIPHASNSSATEDVA
jgi:PAS domain S-box-containing protein